MTNLRRVAALVGSGLLLHLNVLSVARECANPREATPDHSEHADHSQSPLSNSESQSQAQCCDAMSSCAPALQLSDETAVAVAIVESAAAQAPDDAMRAVPRRAPDPPPPRTQAPSA